MSHSLGAALPDALVARLGGRDLARYADLVVPIATVDARGRPHVALLSYSEVVARDRGRLRLAIGGDSASAGNLRRTGAVTLIVVDAGVVIYVKGTAREHRAAMRSSSWNASFDVVVEDVLSDGADPRREGTSSVRSGITFACDPAWAPGREAVLAELLDQTD